MKRPFTNLFTAPDVADILTDRRVTLRNLMLMIGGGIVFVCTLLGGYTVGTWLLVKTSDMSMTPDTTPTTPAPEGAYPEPPSLEERQAAFDSSVMSSTSPEEREAHGEFLLRAGVEPSLEERQKSLESLRGL